jgi:hypothetical protein
MPFLEKDMSYLKKDSQSKHKSYKYIEVKASKDEVRRTYAKLSHFYDFWGILTESKAVGRALNLANIRDGESNLEVASIDQFTMRTFIIFD